MDVNAIFKEIGSKIYRYDENDNLVICRIVGLQNEQVMKVKDLASGAISKVNIKEFLEKWEWQKLKADGIISFALCDVGQQNNQIYDVIAALYRTDDIEEQIKEPWCVCRQNITDIFYNFFKTGSESDIDYVGLCMSRDSCPIDFDYNIMTACNGITASVTVNVYIEDSLDDILGCFHTNIFDSALDTLMKARISYIEYNSGHKLLLDPNRKDVHGYCKDLRTLLELNNFMMDFDSGFKIMDVDCEVEYDETGSLRSDITSKIEFMMKKRILKTYALEYDRSIDVDRLEMNYIFLRDPNKQIYIVGYILSAEEYIETDPEVLSAKNALIDIINGRYNMAKYK